MSGRRMLTVKERHLLTEFAIEQFNTVDGNELGDDWWTSYMGYDINIWYDYEDKGYVATAYSIKDGCTESSVYERLTNLN